MKVEALEINESDLNTKRILELMAIKSDEPVPLYMHTIYRILRNMRLEQQQSGGKFDYQEFKRQIMDSGLLPAQLVPLNQRLDTLESFMPKSQFRLSKKGKEKAALTKAGHNNWGAKVGSLESTR